MKAQYVVLASASDDAARPAERVIDTVDWSGESGDEPAYETGRARTLIESWIAQNPRLAAERVRRGWSNGYVLTRPVG